MVILIETLEVLRVFEIQNTALLSYMEHYQETNYDKAVFGETLDHRFLLCDK